jgi:uncharacterized protein (UPF0261 family)
MRTHRTIAVLGALDTKSAEFSYLIGRITERGHLALMIDTSVMKEPPFVPEISAKQVAAAGGASLQDLRTRGDRGAAVEVMARGAAKIVAGLHSGNKIFGIIGMGGSGATAVFATAVESLPLGFPKLLVTTLASGDTSGFVGAKDLALLPSVVDIAGLNRISRQVIANAAGAICGMVEEATDASEAAARVDREIIAATMLGNTTPAVNCAREILEKHFEVLVFHAIGSGGRTMESLIADRMISGVFDITTTELAAELLGAPATAGPRRLRSAGEQAIPQVIAPGCMDLVIFMRRETVPERFVNRLLYSWSPEFTLMRTTPEECAALGQLLAERANSARGPLTVILPLRGLSALDAPGKDFWDPEADVALFDALRHHLNREIPLVEMDVHINDPEFARCAALRLLEAMTLK